MTELSNEAPTAASERETPRPAEGPRFAGQGIHRPPYCERSATIRSAAETRDAPAPHESCDERVIWLQWENACLP